jgi:hypothetical protein
MFVSSCERLARHAGTFATASGRDCHQIVIFRFFLSVAVGLCAAEKAAKSRTWATGGIDSVLAVSAGSRKSTISAALTFAVLDNAGR